MSIPFKKMRLIQEEEYERLRQKQVASYNPELRVVAHLEDEMKDIMDSRSITPEDKLKLFEQLRLRSSEMRNQTKPAIALGGVSSILPIQPTEPLKIEPVIVKKEEPIDELMGRVSEKHKKNATKLIDIISSNPDVLSINDNQELVINGKIIPNTNFSDIFTSLYSERHSKSIAKIEGITSFLSALDSLHVPSKLITNKSLSKDLEDLKPKPKSKKPQTGKGFSVPGKIQRILRVYHVK